jgi:hypothetical protein
MLTVVVLLASSVAAADLFTGTWKMDNIIQKIEADEKGMKLIRDIIAPAGQTIHQEFALKFDGKDAPVTVTVGGEGQPDVMINTISAKRVDEYTIEFVGKKDGREVTRSSFTVSKDGKTLIFTQSTNGAAGPVPNKMVFQKQ